MPDNSKTTPGVISALAGPAIVGIAVWCACGQVAVETASSAAARIVVPAPWWHFVLGVTGAALIPGFRRDARLALPALLSTIPWWPVPLPAVALIWTGPMAWGPIAAAAVAALVSRAPASTDVTSTGAFGSSRSAWLAAALTAAMVLAAAWSAWPRGPGGDEPHYLVIAQSLIRDGDLRIENNHHDPKFIAAFGDLKPDFIKRGRDGQIYSIHAPGLGAVVAPAFWLAGYRGAQATIAGLTAWTGALVWLIGWRATRDARAAWFAWAAVVGSATFLLQGFVVFPDAPGAFAVAAAVWLVVRLADADDRVPPAALAAVSCALALLPWLHTRFSVLALGLGLVIVWLVLTDSARPMPDRIRRVAAFAAIPAISAAAWFGYFRAIYGTWNPAVPYGDTSGRDGTHLAYAPGGLTGLLFDEQFGLLVYAPVLIVALAGLSRLTNGRVGRAALAAALVAAAYLFIAATYWMWWAGVPATPARLVTATLPVLAVPLARLWTARPDRRPAFVMLLGVTLAVSFLVISIDHTELAWNARDAQGRLLQWLGPVVNLRRGWPSFFWRLDPGRALSELPFLIHVVLWLVVSLVGWLLLVRPRRPERLALGVAWCLLIVVLVAVGLGWSITGGSSLDPARSQLAVLGEIARGRRAVRLGAWSIQRGGSPADIMRIAPEEAGPEGTRAWAIWSGVPPGPWRVHLGLIRPRAGQVRVRFGPEALSAQAIDLQPLSDQTFPIVVPAAVGRLSIELDDGLQSVVRKIELIPAFNQ